MMNKHLFLNAKVYFVFTRILSFLNDFLKTQFTSITSSVKAGLTTFLLPTDRVIPWRTEEVKWNAQGHVPIGSVTQCRRPCAYVIRQCIRYFSLLFVTIWYSSPFSYYTHRIHKPSGLFLLLFSFLRILHNQYCIFKSWEH